MRVLTYTVPEKYDKSTVLTFLRKGCGVSARLLAKLKRVDRGITADGVHVRSIDRLRQGQVVALRMPEDTIRLEPVDMPLDIVYEDEDVLVVNKPPYLAVHPSAGHEQPTLAAAVAAHYIEEGTPMAFRPINRLDRNTSGLLLAAKNAHAAHLLSGKPSKEYDAIVCGNLEGEGVIEQPIRVKQGFGITREVGEGGKYCLTRWKSVMADEELSHLKVVIETGRTHQIRVHMAWLGHPLVGDTMYGTDTIYLPRHGLHCSIMRFTHPVTGENIELQAPMPQDMRQLLQSHYKNQ